MKKENKKKIVIMLPEESIAKILEANPEVELQIADQVLTSTSNRVIKKALNNNELIDFCKKKADKAFEQFVREMGVEFDKGYPHKAYLSSAVTKVLKPMFETFLMQVADNFLFNLNKEEWASYIDGKVGSYMSEIASRIMRESTKDIKSAATKIAEEVIREKLGVK
ncbi:MAG: hypothetical protein WCS56_00180 [Bacilli bacterium]